MPIVTKLAGLRTPGSHPAMVIEVCKDPSKNGNPMLTILWKALDPNFEGQGVRQWIVMNNKWGLEKFAKLKVVFGLAQSALSDDFVGQKAIIKVKLDEPNAEGKQYSSVEDVYPFKAQPRVEQTHADTIPF